MKKLRIFLTLLFILAFSSLVNAQNSTNNLPLSLLLNPDSIDYIKIRNQVVSTSCSKVDTFSVNNSIRKLLSLDTSKITNGLIEYHYDLGMNYYFKAAFYEQNKWLYLAIASFNRSISIDSTWGDCYYNISLINYFFLKQVTEAKRYLVLYKKFTDEAYWNKDFIEKIEKAKENDE
ncbi:MAG: hypothetical protein JXR34_13425 [Bacteroidales bacterium]|nr:hypothetical protein [Bacteroidales bacterium]